MSATSASDLLRSEHRLVEIQLDQLLDAVKHPTDDIVSDLRRALAGVQRLLQPHFEKEEGVVYPYVRAQLSELLSQLDGRRFAEEEGEDEEEHSQNKADREIEVVRRLPHRKPDGRSQEERQAEAQEETAFHGDSLRESHRSRFGAGMGSGNKNCSGKWADTGVTAAGTRGRRTHCNSVLSASRRDNRQFTHDRAEWFLLMVHFTFVTVALLPSSRPFSNLFSSCLRRDTYSIGRCQRPEFSFKQARRGPEPSCR